MKPPSPPQLFQRAAVLLALTTCTLTGCRKKADADAGTAIQVQAAHPTTGSIAEMIEADAVLAPLSQAAISPRISAPIRAEYVQRGAHVHRGQLLITLEDRDLQGNALDSKGSVLSAQANYQATTQASVPENVTKAQQDAAQAKTAYDVAQRTTAERQRLFREGALSGRDADVAVAAEAQAKANYETARAHAEAVARVTRITDAQNAKGQLTSAKGKLQNADAQVSYANLRSPIDGIVTDRPLFPGETASAASPVITVMDTSSLLAKLHLAQATAQKLSVGRSADVHVPGVEDVVKAKVSFISPALDAGSTTVEVWLQVPNAAGRLKVGTPVHASILGTTVSNALQVPASAIVPGQEGGTAVMLIGAEGAAQRRAVTVGLRTADFAQILSGVTPSDEVITAGGYGLDEGTKVVIATAGAADSAPKDKD